MGRHQPQPLFRRSKEQRHSGSTLVKTGWLSQAKLMVLPSLVLGPEAFINYQALVSSLYNGIDMTRLSGLLGEIKKVAQSMYCGVSCRVGTQNLAIPHTKIRLRESSDPYSNTRQSWSHNSKLTPNPSSPISPNYPGNTPTTDTTGKDL